MQATPSGVDEDVFEDEESEEDGGSSSSSDISGSGSVASGSSDSEADESDSSADEEAAAAGSKESLEHYQQARKEVLASQQSLMTNGGCLLRSKGFVWLASSPGKVVEWSSSGLLLELSMSHPWFCTLPEVSGSQRGGRLQLPAHMCSASHSFPAQVFHDDNVNPLVVLCDTLDHLFASC